MVVDHGSYNVTTYIKQKKEKQKQNKRKEKQKDRQHCLKLHKMITVIPLLSDSFMEGKDSWIKFKEYNKIIQRLLSITIPVIVRTKNDRLNFSLFSSLFYFLFSFPFYISIFRT